MKYNKIIFGLLIILLSACTNESKNNYRLLLENDLSGLNLIDDKGNEIMFMNFNDDGTLLSFMVMDRDRNYSVTFLFDANSIISYAVGDERLNYGSSTIFYPNEESKLFRMEVFDKFRVIEQILNDGNVIIQTSNTDDYLQEGEDPLEVQDDWYQIE